jgi:hypothetical protein
MRTRSYLEYTLKKLDSKTAADQMPKVVGTAREEVDEKPKAATNAPLPASKPLPASNQLPQAMEQSHVEAFDAKIDALNQKVDAIDRGMHEKMDQILSMLNTNTARKPAKSTTAR